jgi:ATP-binding cassette subfamily B protein RaxB
MRLEGRGIVVGADEVAALRLPCILHWNDDHFVVLARRRLRSVVIHDPARGEKVLTWPEFQRFFSGIALELSPMIGFESRPMRERLHWRQVTGRTSGLKRGVSQILIVATCLQLFALAGPLLSQWVIDDAIASSDSDLVWVICIGLTLSLL